MSDRKKLEKGMLLLGNVSGDPGKPLDRVWSVSKVTGTTATLVSYESEKFSAEATLRGNTVPDGWAVLDPRKLATLVAREPFPISFQQPVTVTA